MNLKLLLVIFTLIFIYGCSENNKTESVNKSDKKNIEVIKDTIQTPLGYIKLQVIEGDLDKDNIPEKVIVFDTKRKTDFGTEREIQIFKRNDNKWEIWHKSVGAILPSQHGGVMGDPFNDISIKNSTIIIKQHGGSREKWEYQHVYRYQRNTWKLIGASIKTETPCDNKISFDYNLSTGKAIISKEKIKCDNNAKVISTIHEKKEVKNKLKDLPDMDGYYPGDNEFEIKELNETIYY